MDARIFEKDYGLKKVIRVRGEGNHYYNFQRGTLDKVSEGEMLNPELVFALPTEVYNAIAQAMKADNSVPSPKRDFIEGKLEATEKHLEDMRKIVFTEDE